jgi:hypothetical protein
MNWDTLSDFTRRNIDKRTTKGVSDGHTTKATLQIEANSFGLLGKIERSGYVERIATGPERSSSVKCEESACEGKEE